MFSHPQFAQNAEEVQALRLQAGRWIRVLRERAGLSQRELAKAVGFEYYTFISQIESGRGRLPPAQYLAFATALGIPVHEFVKTLMRYYDPITYYALFETTASTTNADYPAPAANDHASNKGTSNVAELAARLARLEALLESKT